MAAIPSKMNTNNRDFKVIFTRRLAEEVNADECDATRNPEGLTLVCSKEHEDDTDNPRKENVKDHEESRKDENYKEAYFKLVGGRNYDLDGREVEQLYPFSVIHFIAIFFSVIFFIIDFITDIMLAKDYYDDGMMLEFALTSLFVAGSLLVTGILSSIWHAQEKKEEGEKKEKKEEGEKKEKKEEGEKKQKEKKRRNYRNICLTILKFPFATIERYINYAIHGYKSKQKENNEFYHYIEMIFTDLDASLLRMFEAFIESAPQLVLQICLILRELENLKNCEDIEVHSDKLRMLTVLSSWVSVSWSVTAYYRALRVSKAMDKTHQKTLLASTGYFLWRAFEIGSRVMALVMMILINPIIFALIVVFHWFAVITWSFATNAMPYKKFHENAIFIVFVGFVQVFSFMNIKGGKSRSHAWLYYTFFYIENIVILILWIIVKKESYCPWIYYGSIGIVSSGIVFTLVFIACFYKLCHPKTGIKSIN
ncbi:XK-related protein 6 [Magallana gigas]|uniref:XK-related protein 6 n=1 Tax=Magallana gigas TaxID=29159 RepID=UPI00333E4780